MKNIKRGSVYIVDLREVDDEFNGFYPVLILQNDKGNRYCDTTFGVPIDISKKTGRSYIPIEAEGLHSNSKILCNHLLSFERNKVHRFLFTLDDERMKQVDAVMVRMLGIGSFPK